MAKFRFGKHPAKHDYRTLRLKNYLSTGLQPPPDAYDVLPRVYKGLGVSADPTALFPMDGNDSLGDCTIAALAHATTVYNGLVGKREIPKASTVTKLYMHLTGGVDSGLAELDVLSYWRKHSVSGDRILAFAKVDVKNHVQIKQAIHLFGGVYIGFQVQENCEEEFNAGKPWTPGRLTQDGHAVYATGYDAHHLTVLTWCNTQKATWGWWDECVDEAYAILPEEAKLPKFSGFDLERLKADLELVAQGVVNEPALTA